MVSDGTGTVTAVFAGRRRIPGIDHGRAIVLEGVAVDRRRPLGDLQPGVHPRPVSPVRSLRRGRRGARARRPPTRRSPARRTSSPTRSTVSPRGTIRRSARSTATTVASRGTPSSTISLPSAGEPSARRTSASRALPPSNDSRRTNEPTLTASSTSAVIRCGVETATSTPHRSLNIHSFFGLFTRATTRGHAELLLGEQRHDEVVLVVTGDRGDDLGLLDAAPTPACRARRRRPRTTSTPAGSPGATCLADDAAVVVDDGHVVPGAVQLLGDEAADAAPAGDHDAHVSAPSRPAPAGRRRPRRGGRPRRRGTARRRPGRRCGRSGSSPRPSG